MVKICTYNARGLRDFNKRKQLFMLLKYKNFDVVFIQESHMVDSEISLWRSQWGGEIFCANGSTNSKGVLILFRKNLQYQVNNVIKDDMGRFLVMEVQLEDMELLFINVYAPNIDTPSFFERISQITYQCENPLMMWGGDFNFVVNNDLDRKFFHYNNDKARDYFIQYAEDNDLCDIWRVLNPASKQYSCCRPNTDSDQWQKFSRLDMFFINSSLLSSVKRAVMQTGFQSDHSFVWFDISLAQVPHGPGYWKFNTLHLREKKFIIAANVIIEEQILNNKLNPALLWEKVKGELTTFCKSYSIDKAKERNKDYLDMQKELDKLKLKIEQDTPIDGVDILRYQEIQNKLERYMQDKAQGACLRSKAQFYDLGERSSKYYFALEKSNAKKKALCEIKLPNGQTTSDKARILQEVSKYYKELYQSNSTINFNLKNDSDIKISNADKLKLDQDISLQELTTAVFSMPNNKTPGIDGLPIEIYKTFWDKLGQLYYDAIIYAKENGILNINARRGVITQIPKKDRDPMIIPHWRPLTMLNCDYKILAKALALRLQPILPSIISEDQTGFMKGRNIATNIRETIEAV